VVNTDGKSAVIPPGRYVTGTIILHYYVHVESQPGAVFAGSPDIEDYVDVDKGAVPPEFPSIRCLSGAFVSMDSLRQEYNNE